MNPRAAIIMLNWNGYEDTIPCLDSLFQITYDNFHVVLVDNASTDASVQKIREYARNRGLPLLDLTRTEAEAKPPVPSKAAGMRCGFVRWFMHSFHQSKVWT